MPKKQKLKCNDFDEAEKAGFEEAAQEEAWLRRNLKPRRKLQRRLIELMIT
jgi:hypothetical protein